MHYNPPTESISRFFDVVNVVQTKTCFDSLQQLKALLAKKHVVVVLSRSASDPGFGYSVLK
jgi:hypothetical protein